MHYAAIMQDIQTQILHLQPVSKAAPMCQGTVLDPITSNSTTKLFTDVGVHEFSLTWDRSPCLSIPSSSV